jgi:N-acetylglucosaminyldiphosphoundecaprenol N-acetyl-beta-D-mannosaminyltransferase
MQPISRANILGVGVSAVNMATTLQVIEGWIARRERHYVCVTGVHGVMESQRDARLRQIHNSAGLVTPDGMPLVWLSRAHGLRGVTRVYGPDLMLGMCERSVSLAYRHYFYGGSDGVAQRLADRLCELFPGMSVAGAYSPPFRPLTADEDETIMHMINDTNPDLVWVGLSTPKQELWMAAHVDRLVAPVLLGVGAAFDFHAGTKRQAPSWMQRIGLEWSFRLMTEPRRLWKRYLVNNPSFVFLVALQTLGLRRYSL